MYQTFISPEPKIAEFQGAVVALGQLAEGQGDQGKVYLNNVQRTAFKTALGASCVIKIIDPSVFPIASDVELEMGFASKKSRDKVTADGDKLRQNWATAYGKIPINKHGVMMMAFEGEDYEVRVVELKGCRPGAHGEKVPTPEPPAVAMFSPNITRIVFKKNTGGHNADKLQIEDSQDQALGLFAPSFNWENLDIGGLDEEFQTLFRRAFVSRLFPPKYMREMGIRHVKGVLLYGPPGTGKTLMARQISKMLNTVEPKIVNGPEIFSKFVGESEQNIRNLFADAKKDQDENGDYSRLHLIVFDEFEAICKKRGTVGGTTGVADTVVNQLLSMIDGVDQLNNVLLIGMTNRKDLIDDAILRPGRFEVHIEISLPDEPGREQIFRIHTRGLRAGGGLASDVDIHALAVETRNYTGAEIEGVVKVAMSNAMSAVIDPATQAPIPDKRPIVSQTHLLKGLEEVRPAHGVDQKWDEVFMLHGIVDFADDQRAIHRGYIDRVQAFRQAPGEHGSATAFLVSGADETGVSSFAWAGARLFDCVRVISGEQFVGKSEDTIAVEIKEVIDAAYRSRQSAVLFDVVERIVEYTPIGIRFLNRVLNTILSLIRLAPPKGHRIAFFMTCRDREVLTHLGLTPSLFRQEIILRALDKWSEVQIVAQECLKMKLDWPAGEVDAFLSNTPIPIKKLLRVLIEASRAGPVGWLEFRSLL